MENKLNVKEQSKQIVFIDRKKKKSIFEEYFNSFKQFILFKNYKEEKIMFRILYDKIYRPELYRLITKGGSKNLNMTRNLFTLNEEKFPYVSLKKNDQLSFDDDDLCLENNFVLKIHRSYLIHKITLYLTIPAACLSLYYLFYNKSPLKSNLAFISCLILLFTNLGNMNKKEKMYNDENYKIILDTNKGNLDLYKNFYYDL